MMWQRAIRNPHSDFFHMVKLDGEVIPDYMALDPTWVFPMVVRVMGTLVPPRTLGSTPAAGHAGVRVRVVRGAADDAAEGAAEGGGRACALRGDARSLPLTSAAPWQDLRMVGTDVERLRKVRALVSEDACRLTWWVPPPRHAAPRRSRTGATPLRQQRCGARPERVR